MKNKLTLIAIVVLVALAYGFAVWKLHVPTSAPAIPAPYPTTLMADQVILKDTLPSSPAPAGYQALKDNGINATFNAPIDWKPAYLPEGDGKASIVSPDFSNPLGSMTGAYLHYSYASLPDGFSGGPEAYMASLKQGMVWSDTVLDGHPAYITKTNNDYSMVVSQFSDNWFVTVSFADPTRKYGSVFDEFIRSFHAQ